MYRFFTCSLQVSTQTRESLRLQLNYNENMRFIFQCIFSMSGVWQHFKKSKNEVRAQCKHCTSTIKCVNTTSGLRSHLISQHNINPDTTATGSCARNKSTQKTIPFQSINQFKFEEEVARLAAYDGIPFATIAKSQFIQESLKKKYSKILQSPSSIQTNVIKFGKIKEVELKEKLHNDPDARFGLSFDEWTSVDMKRYISITLFAHDESFNLGMIPITGKADAKKICELIAARLKDFGLDLNKHIILIVCDGASVNVRYGKDVGIDMQLCLNHGLHLAVTDVIYDKKKVSNDMGQGLTTNHVMSMLFSEHEEPNETEDATIIDDDDNSSGSDDESDEENSDSAPEDVNGGHEFNNEELKEVIKVLRNVIKFINKTASRRDILRKEVVKMLTEQKKKVTALKLLLYCRTRWDSLVKMVERFLLLLPCVRSTLLLY